MHLNPLIVDLALIMLYAGAITLLFKALKQPVVLGYIVAGVLASSHFSFTPSVQDVKSIHIWAEIGIIFLLFALGLEFSFKKLLKVGGASVIAASFIMIGMMLTGFFTGKMLGWSQMDAVFLGAMLSMSSTTIIIKAFDDLGIKNQRFTGTVFGVLVIEDLFAILMMVILSSLSLSHNFDSLYVSETVFKLVFFLIIWFLSGLFLIPVFLKSMKRHLNAETLLVVAIALCLGMVVVANYAGFSSALGAFIMGSLLAETIEAESIEKIIKPVKDLFGAVFFVSVGMLVDFSVLSDYLIPVVVITLVVVLGQIFFATTGVLVSGQPLRVAMQSGFSLAQIGEFAFIIAGLGASLGVTGHFLYPIAVAVAVITTFLTPFIIRMAEPAFQLAERKMPLRWREFLDRFSAGSSTVNRKSDWHILSKALTLHMLLHAIVMSGIIWSSFKFYVPFLNSLFEKSIVNPIAAISTLLVMSPFLWSMAFKRVRKDLFRSMWIDTRYNHGPLIALGILRAAITGVFVMVVLVHFFSFRLGTLLGLTFAGMTILLFSRQIRRTVLSLEKTLKRNLSAREDARKPQINNLIHDVHMAEFEVSPDSELIGRYLYKADFRNNYGVSIVSIHRGSRRINIPGARDQLMPFDRISVVGNDEELKAFGLLVEQKDIVELCTQQSCGVSMQNLTIDENSLFVGKSIKESNFNLFNCLIISVERRGEGVLLPSASLVFQPGDLVTLVGQQDKMQSIIQGFCPLNLSK